MPAKKERVWVETARGTRPLCDCCDRPMGRDKHSGWRCMTKRIEAQRRHRARQREVKNDG
jgi:hypothetical protein